MSFTEHEMGSVPSETDPTTPTSTQPPAPFKGAHKIWAIIGIIVLGLTFWPIALVLGFILRSVNERRYRTVGIVGISVGFVSMAITGMFYFLLLNVVPMALNNAAVAPIVPDTTVSATQEPAPSVAVPAPAPTVTPDTSGLAVQPLASSASDLVAKIESYRDDAFRTGDMTLLDKYYPSHQNTRWQHDYAEIVTDKTASDVLSTIVDIKLLSVTSTKVVSDVTIKTRYTVNGTTKTEVYTSHNTYEVVSGRWYLTS